MSVDSTSRGIRRVADTSTSNTQSTENKPLENPASNSQQDAASPKNQSQNAEAANSRKAEAGMMANQLQSQLLNQTNSTRPNRTDSDADLQRAFKMYGITDEQLKRYVTTGETPEGLKKAINDASTKGEWLAVNVVRTSFQKRVEYLRANSGPNDKEAHAQADQLDAATASLLRNRQGIAIQHAEDKLKSSNYSKHPTKAENQSVQATKNLQDIGSEIENQLKAQSAPLRKKH